MHGNVFIVGLGLIGGSIALSIKKQHPEAVIYGYDVRQSAINVAKSLTVIDEKVTSFRTAAESADLIILSTPVVEMKKVMKQLSTLTLKKDVIITDTGSTKTSIMKLANDLWKDELTFIGGHPMAGSHKSGVESAKTHLLENAYYLLTPLAKDSGYRIKVLQRWLEGTNANFLVIDVKEHDVITGVISHFPHLIAAGLVNLVRKESDSNPLVSLLAAGGFRDITRIASSNPNMWKDIVKQNRDNLINLLDKWVVEMNNMRSILLQDEEQAITDLFQEAKDFRDALPVRSKGAIPSYYDLYVDVVDTPGAIANITTILAKEGISITNLHIIESREGLLGVLRISFQKEEDRTKAQELLKTNDYNAFEAA